MSKAAERALCICCNKDFPEHQALIDPDIGGPVDPDCQSLLVWSASKLHKAGFKRCFKSTDMNEHNFERGFQ